MWCGVQNLGGVACASTWCGVFVLALSPVRIQLPQEARESGRSCIGRCQAAAAHGRITTRIPPQLLRCLVAQSYDVRLHVRDRC